MINLKKMKNGVGGRLARASRAETRGYKKKPCVEWGNFAWRAEASPSGPKVSKFHDFKVPRFQDPKIPRFPEMKSKRIKPDVQVFPT